MGGERRARILAMAAIGLSVGLVVFGGSACGSGTLIPTGPRGGAGGGGHAGGTGLGGRAGSADARDVDASGAARDGGTADASCSPPTDLTPEPAPRQIALDGGVPIEQLAYARALARCDYQRRCFGAATYLTNGCVDSVASIGSWGYQFCNGSPTACSGRSSNFLLPNSALLNAVATGVVRYYPAQEARCMAALLAQGCASDQLIEAIAECTGIFGCPPPADGGTAPTTDGGATCTQFIPAEYQIWHTCTTDADCVGQTSPQGPDCVAGFCAPTPCGIDIGGCTSLATAGQACASSYLSLVMTGDTVTSAMCAPGLNCQRPPASGPPCVVAPGNACPGVPLGTCVVPVDVGGACTDDANCKPGLACACGICEIPPSTGPCLNGNCQAGAAYCDIHSDTCQPVRPKGASCADAVLGCAPGLDCNGTVCALPGG